METAKKLNLDSKYSYEAPIIEIVEVNVEVGFQDSPLSPASIEGSNEENYLW